MGYVYIPSTERMLSIVGGPNQLHLLVRLDIFRQGG